MPNNIFREMFSDGPDIEGDDPQELAEAEYDEALDAVLENIPGLDGFVHDDDVPADDRE